MVRFPVGKKVVGCKLVYIVKYGADESIEGCKLQLLSKGFAQTYELITKRLCTICKDEHRQSFVSVSSKLWLEFTTILCQECFLAWRSWGRNLYGGSTMLWKELACYFCKLKMALTNHHGFCLQDLLELCWL